MYLYGNNIYGWEMSQDLPVKDLNKKKTLLNLMLTSQKSMIKIEIDIKYPENLDNLHDDSPCLQSTMRIKKGNKLGYNLYDKKNYVVDIKTLKQALNYGLVL